MATCRVCGEHGYGPLRQHTTDKLQMPLLYAHRHYGRVWLHEIEWIPENSSETVIRT